MADSDHRLSFERPIFELEARLKKLDSKDDQTTDVRNEIRLLRRQLTELKKSIYNNLTPWETVEVARHPDRPMTTDYLELVFDEFVELHGDKCFGDDRAIRCGWAKLDTFKVMVVGHQKGKTLQERNACYFGRAHPEGYRKAMGKMRLAAKYNLPVICFIDTPGAYPGIGAEERGQAQVIAESMFEMSRLRTPVICVVIGEGGSGGALGLGVGDRVSMLQHSYYSVISPEGCAGIIWKSHTYKQQAAEALKMTSKDLPGLGIVDDVIAEPLGGAHRDHHLMASQLKIYLRKSLRELVDLPTDELVEKRYEKFRRMGKFLEASEQGGAEQETIRNRFPRLHEGLTNPNCAVMSNATSDPSQDSSPKKSGNAGRMFVLLLLLVAAVVFWLYKKGYIGQPQNGGTEKPAAGEVDVPKADEKEAGDALKARGMLVTSDSGRVYLVNALGKEITDEDAKHIASFKALGSLSFENCTVADERMSCVSGLAYLTNLDLNYSTVSDEGLAHLGKLPELTSLHLRETKVTDKGLPELAGLEQLIALDLTRTQITDEGLKHLAGLKNLQNLVLTGTNITDAGLKHLESLKNLKVVNLSKTGATRAGIDSLKKAVPGLLVQ